MCFVPVPKTEVTRSSSYVHHMLGRFAPHWEMCDFRMGMGSCFYPMKLKKHQSSHA